MKKLLVMKKNNSINIGRIEDGKLVNFTIYNKNNVSLAGNIYVGRVEKIVKNAFAFINIGEDKTGFLDLGDNKEKDLVTIDGNKRKINIKQGDTILVQVDKDGTDIKGPALTSEVSIKGNSILMIINKNKTIGVSKKISSGEKRKELKKLGKQFQYSVIFRTETENMEIDEIVKEYKELEIIRNSIVDKAQYEKPPKLIKSGGNDMLSIIQKMSNDIEAIYVGNDGSEEFFSSCELKDLVIVEDSVNIFSSHYVQKYVDELYKKKLWLKSGGFIIIEYTEACTVVDVNTGKNISGGDREKIIFKTNVEACYIIAEQMRLRNLSGIIIVDFVDMRIKENKGRLLEKMKKIVKNDKVPVEVHGLSNLGLMEITRKKTSESIKL